MDELEEYEKYKKIESNVWNKLLTQIKPIHVVLIIVIPMIAYGLYASGSINKPFLFGIIIIMGAIIFYLIARPSKEKKLIPEWVIKEMAAEALEKKRRKGNEIPFDAKVRVLLAGRSKYEWDFGNQSSGPVSWHIGFEVIHGGLKKTGIIEMHPYTGEVTGFRYPEMLGFTGNEVVDVKLIPATFIDTGRQDNTQS